MLFPRDEPRGDDPFGLTVSDVQGTFATLDGWDTDASFEEKARKCGLNPVNGGYEVCWGISDYGDNRYAVEYDLGGLAALAEAFDDDDNKRSQYDNLKVMLKVNTLYLSEYELCDLSVSGKGHAAYANDLAREMGKVNAICNLIVSLAGGVTGEQTAAAPSADRTADDIMKFKELLDAGVITQAEFDAKKKQLLGL